MTGANIMLMSLGLQVKWVEQQQVLERDKRSIIPDFVGIEHPKAVIIQDPLYKDQWYLVRTYLY